MENQPVSNSNRSYKIIVIVAVIITAVAIGIAVFSYNDAQVAKKDVPEAVAAKNLAETERVVKELGSILQLVGDNPTVARVEDPSVLQESNPDFYKDIQVGDYLVLYPQRAIVYRSSEKKIINIAPIVNTEQLQQRTEDQSTQPAAEGSEQ